MAARADVVTQYARSVTSGKTPACKFVKQAAKRHIGDLKKSKTKAYGYRYDPALAAHCLKFFTLLSLTKGRQFRGKPFKLEPWQSFIVGSLFGWVEKGTGYRRYRYAYVEVPRKNGKSELAAGIGLLLAFFDGEEGAEVYAAATKRDQAKIVWEVARDMVRQSHGLQERIKAWKLNMHAESTNSKFEPLGADSSTMDGLNIHGVIIDELHAHKDRRLMDVLETATGSRVQPLMFEITTAGEYDPESICWKHREYSTRVLSEVVSDASSDRWFGYIATIDKGDQWDDPKVWIKANPNIGVSKSIETIRLECDKAKSMPADENKFRRYHLDEWTKQATRWMTLEAWQKCERDYDEKELLGKTCWAGLDLAATSDINALVLLFPDQDYKVLPYFWVPEDMVATRTKRDRQSYQAWVDSGLLRTTPGAVTRYDAIRDFLGELKPKYNISQIGIDEWNAIHLAMQLEDDGFDVVLMKQNMHHMAPPTKELERLVMQGALSHPGHPVLSWMFDNVAIRRDSDDNIKIDRDKSREKVDGMVALVMALGVFIKQSQAKGGSVYDERGVLALTDWFS